MILKVKFGFAHVAVESAFGGEVNQSPLKHEGEDDSALHFRKQEEYCVAIEGKYNLQENIQFNRLIFLIHNELRQLLHVHHEHK